jgi:chaperonin GroES
MLRPLGDRIIVKNTGAKDTTKGGILLPDTAQEKPTTGEVIAAGPGRTLDNGQTAPIEVQAGDKVVYQKYGGTEVKVDGEDYIILRQDDVLAKL